MRRRQRRHGRQRPLGLCPRSSVVALRVRDLLLQIGRSFADAVSKTFDAGLGDIPFHLWFIHPNGDDRADLLDDPIGQSAGHDQLAQPDESIVRR